MNKSNKDLASSFLKLVTKGNIEEAFAKYISDNFKHHNMYFSSDPDSLKKGMLENQSLHPDKLFEIKHLIEERDIVIAHSHLRFNKEEEGLIVVHIMKFEDGKITEMWDVGQQIPTNSKNELGAF
ncbi:MAG: polyketide cyclase [Candidatus Nomurabacteria bacterium]|nr:polyketide cyclase [Candidatus Nomurabacteria bacterium]